MRKTYLGCSLAALAALAGACSQQRYPDPLSAEETLETFQLDSAFRLELFAAEPLVMDPVEMAFDENGKVYVVEMGDYPFKPEPGMAKGRIKVLEDTDGDGRADEATIFADSLSEATSMLPWKGGLIVTTAPHILYLKDTTGDNKADLSEVLFSGFFENNSEAQITNLRYEVDNWVYASNHGQAGEITFHRKSDEPAVSVQGADFRFRLDSGLFEPETGPAQFGQAFTDWGDRFFTQNTIHIQHAVIPWRYLNRHPYLPPATKAVLNISDHDLRMFQETPAPYWRAERTRRRQQEYKERGLDRNEYAEDHFTGASGGTVYTGTTFPESYYGSVFTGEVAGNLIHRDVLEPLEDSPTFKAVRAAGEQDREFLSTTDSWFRPVNFGQGPDGNLYVIDMYRQHIETPLSIPEDLKEDMDFLEGNERGRIYRIVPKNNDNQQQGENPLPGTLETAELVPLLAHKGRWWRLQAQRLLLERQDRGVIPRIKEMLQENEDPRARLHALYTLEGLHALDAGLVRRAMNDPHPGLSAHGIKLAERFPECLPDVIRKSADTAVRVAFQATLSLGEFPSGKQVVTALADVMERYGQDPWFRMAVLSSDAGSSVDLLAELSRRAAFFGQESEAQTAFLGDVAYVTGARCQSADLQRFIKLIAGAPFNAGLQLAALTGLENGLKKNGEKPSVDPGVKDALSALGEHAAQNDADKAVSEQVNKIMEQLK